MTEEEQKEKEADELAIQVAEEAEAKELEDAEAQRLAEEAEAEKAKGVSSETLEAKRARLQRQLDQTNKKLGIESEVKPKSGGVLGYGEKAFLVASGIKGAEIKLVQEAMKRTGETLEEILENPYFQAKLKEARELAGTVNATPKGKGGTGVPTDSVEYWMQKPIEEVPQDLRIKVVNAKLAKEGNKLSFYNS